MSTANEKQVGGNHYKTVKGGVEHWDYVSKVNVPYLEGCASKYVARWRNKNGVQDLEKSLHYIEKRLEEHRNHSGILKAANRSDGLFNRFIADNGIPVRERGVIDAIMHWKRIDQLIGAHAEIEAMIREYNVGEATPAYVKQDR